jgi:hypothetical protein
VVIERRCNSTQGGYLKRVVKEFNVQLDSVKNQSIVNSSDEKTPPEGAGNTNQGLTGHADDSSMAAESYSNLALSSRQLMGPALLAPSTLLPGSPVGDSLRSRRVEYVPPTEAEVSQYARDVCAALSKAIPSAHFGEPEVQAGFQRFMMVVVRIVAKQANAKGTPWTSESDKNPPVGRA